MNKIYSFSDEKGIYLCFNEFEREEQFDEFLAFLAKCLDASILPKVQGPYSTLADIKFQGSPLLAMYHGNTGCCVRIPLDKPELGDQIIELCYGS